MSKWGKFKYTSKRVFIANEPKPKEWWDKFWEWENKNYGDKYKYDKEQKIFYLSVEINKVENKNLPQYITWKEMFILYNDFLIQNK